MGSLPGCICRGHQSGWKKTGRIKILDSTNVQTATILRRAPGEPYIRITESSRPGGTMSPLVNMSKRPLLEILEFSWQG